MKSVLKSEKTDSPKTPGGISRSLLTPCRRIGLSRNWRNTGISPFRSPLSSSNEVQEEDVKVLRKRKESSNDIVATPERSKDCETSTEFVQTPVRNLELPQRKKSKTLLSTINKSLDNNELKKSTKDVSNSSNMNEIPCTDNSCDKVNEVNTENVQIPISISPNKSKCRSINKISLKTKSKSSKVTITREQKKSGIAMNEELNDNKFGKTEETEKKKKSPNTLSKECVVVLQKKMFKQEFSGNAIVKEKESTSQILSYLFDSDSDDKPLLNSNNKYVSNEEDEFTSKPQIKTTHKLPKTKLKSPKLSKNKPSSKVVGVECVHTPSLSQNSEDDDFVKKRKTILVKKSYPKVIKPQKAKSTGSITQSDIDELKARIETKKKMLLARTMTKDTKELKDLIKKWQKGCQEALMELMNLMRNKFPDKQNMDYSEMLMALKIPASLVGYDSDNDCFLTPNDEDVVLAKFKI